MMSNKISDITHLSLLLLMLKQDCPVFFLFPQVEMQSDISLMVGAHYNGNTWVISVPNITRYQKTFNFQVVPMFFLMYKFSL